MLKDNMQICQGYQIIASKLTQKCKEKWSWNVSIFKRVLILTAQKQKPNEFLLFTRPGWWIHHASQSENCVALCWKAPWERAGQSKYSFERSLNEQSCILCWRLLPKTAVTDRLKWLLNHSFLYFRIFNWAQTRQHTNLFLLPVYLVIRELKKYRNIH